MNQTRRPPRPIRASTHLGFRSTRGLSAPTLLTVYLVLLFALPSNLTIAALGAYGRPQFLWGLFLFGFWAFSRLQSQGASAMSGNHPVKVALAIFFVVALISFAQALLRGQPFDQVSPAVSALLRLVSWSGVALVAMDGIKTVNEVITMMRRLSIAVGAMALVGILQFATDLPLIDFFTSLPGFTGGSAGIDERGGFTRSSGTATHPLEYATALSAGLAIALAVATSENLQRRRAQKQWLVWWIPVVLITLAALIAISRSAIIGLLVAIIAVVPALSRGHRLALLAGGILLIGVTVLVVPGLYGTVLGMFIWFGSDSSAQSRAAGLGLAIRFVADSPLLGSGLGTFLPRYYIFDNQWAQMLVEIGVLGLGSFAALLVTSIWSAASAARTSPYEDIAVYGRAVAASLVTIAVMFALFDALAFPISAGLTFFLIGLSGAIRSVAVVDALVEPASGRSGID